MNIINSGPVRRYAASRNPINNISTIPIRKAGYTPSVPVYVHIPHKSLTKMATPTNR